jgi:hypothetical protein
MGTPHPKALRAASQEAWPDTGQTLGNVAQGSVRSEQYRRNIRKVPRRIDSYLAKAAGAIHGIAEVPSSPIQQGPDFNLRMSARDSHPSSCSANITSRPMFPDPGSLLCAASLHAAPRRFVPHRVRDTKALGSTTGRRSPDAAQRGVVRCRAGAHALDPTLIA